MLHHGVHHVSINVDDVEVNRSFYVDKLGFTDLDRPDFGFGGCWLKMGPQELHLIELPLVQGNGPHFALAVDSVEDASEQLRSLGVEVSDVMTIDRVCRQAFFNDPAGNQIELNEQL
jgi:catechol 2,3-dioxygenase-like lactoylglutathione lyase family enzyme